jgi:hypothetical protein
VYPTLKQNTKTKSDIENFLILLLLSLSSLPPSVSISFPLFRQEQKRGKREGEEKGRREKGKVGEEEEGRAGERKGGEETVGGAVEDEGG